MKVYIVQDGEGVSGVVMWERELDEPAAANARLLMTREINAAVDGALAAGATEVLVHESHKFIFEELHPEARCIMGSSLLRIDESCDAVFIVGQHAMAKTDKGVLCHSFSSKFTREMFLNDEPIGEIGWAAAFAGYFGVPVVLVTGDVAATEEARALLGDIEVAPVKEGLGINSAVCMSSVKAQELIREKAICALKRVKTIKPWVVQPPIEYRVEFIKPIIVERCMLYPGARQLSVTTVAFSSDDFMEIYRFRAFTALVNWF